MKIFSSILLLLILAMNFKPCADELISQGKNIDVSFQNSDDHQHDQQDGCSPFCYCACCSVRANATNQVATELFFSQTAINSLPFTLRYLHQITLPIWQPPQLV